MPAPEARHFRLRAQHIVAELRGERWIAFPETRGRREIAAAHVFALFLTMPYGKFVHSIYRYVALVCYARENG